MNNCVHENKYLLSSPSVLRLSHLSGTKKDFRNMVHRAFITAGGRGWKTWLTKLCYAL